MIGRISMILQMLVRLTTGIQTAVTSKRRISRRKRRKGRYVRYSCMCGSVLARISIEFLLQSKGNTGGRGRKKAMTPEEKEMEDKEKPYSCDSRLLSACLSLSLILCLHFSVCMCVWELGPRQRALLAWSPNAEWSPIILSNQWCWLLLSLYSCCEHDVAVLTSLSLLPSCSLCRILLLNVPQEAVRMTWELPPCVSALCRSLCLLPFVQSDRCFWRLLLQLAQRVLLQCRAFSARVDAFGVIQWADHWCHQ